MIKGIHCTGNSCSCSFCSFQLNSIFLFHFLCCLFVVRPFLIFKFSQKVRGVGWMCQALRATQKVNDTSHTKVNEKTEDPSGYFTMNTSIISLFQFDAYLTHYEKLYKDDDIVLTTGVIGLECWHFLDVRWDLIKPGKFLKLRKPSNLFHSPRTC